MTETINAISNETADISINDGTTTERTTTNVPSVVDPVTELEQLLGTDVILLPVPKGQKGSKFAGWSKVTLQQMSDPLYLANLRQGNIAVLQGSASGNLCSIDIDDDAAAEDFLRRNPKLQSTLRTKGNRGCNVWFRIKGPCPKLTPITTETGINWGEFRADGGQTNIYGIHPNGNAYTRVVDAKPIEISYFEIQWPPGLKPPIIETPEDAVSKKYGKPYSASSKGSITINQSFFAAKFDKEHKVLFDADETQFYLYNPDNGVWEVNPDVAIKNQFKEDICRAADECGETRLKNAVNNRLLNDLVGVLKGHVLKKNPFERHPGVIHLKNGMLRLGEKVTLDGFSPDYLSRNQIPIALNETAEGFL